LDQFGAFPKGQEVLMVLIGPTLLTPLLVLTVRSRLYSQEVLPDGGTHGTRNLESVGGPSIGSGAVLAFSVQVPATTSWRGWRISDVVCEEMM
jgi:hypothetical protein